MINNTPWILLDAETTGFAKPIFAVELAAQRMRGWEKDGAPYRRLLNHGCKIPDEASRVHGYTREILERDGSPPAEVYGEFAAYAGNLPVVAYHLEYDWDQVLLPEWKRLGI
jgi:DNA polymerase-3 subunit epsilon